MPNLPGMRKYNKANSVKTDKEPFDELIDYIDNVIQYLPDDAKGQIGQCWVIRRKTIQLRDKNKFDLKLESKDLINAMTKGIY